MDTMTLPRVAGHITPAFDRWYHGIGRTGMGIVAVVAVVVALNVTAKFLVSEPLVAWAHEFAQEFIYSLVVGVVMLLAVVRACHGVPRRGLRQYVVAAVVVVVVSITAELVGEAIADEEPLLQPGGTGLDHLLWSVWSLLSRISSYVVRYTFIGVVIAAAWLYLRAEAEHVAAMAQCAVDVEQMDRQTAEARLQVLEAQIEPHFLFNTLANVRRLYETDATAGARMLRHLQDYLAVALPELRATDSTLGREVDHAAAYLHIQQIRMNRRLAFTIDLPDALRGARMPSLMVLTLVENAIKHGLAPLPEGGRIDVRAVAEAGRLRVEVADTGRGFSTSSGGGTGLANTRARLASYHGPHASFTLAANRPRGVVATIELPYEPLATAGLA